MMRSRQLISASRRRRNMLDFLLALIQMLDDGDRTRGPVGG
jgi:hypothetical protein